MSWFHPKITRQSKKKESVTPFQDKSSQQKMSPSETTYQIQLTEDQKKLLQIQRTKIKCVQ